MNLKDNVISRSSSFSSLENLSATEGISFIIVNEYAALSTINNKNGIFFITKTISDFLNKI